MKGHKTVEGHKSIKNDQVTIKQHPNSQNQAITEGHIEEPYSYSSKRMCNFFGHIRSHKTNLPINNLEEFLF